MNFISSINIEFFAFSMLFSLLIFSYKNWTIWIIIYTISMFFSIMILSFIFCSCWIIIYTPTLFLIINILALKTILIFIILNFISTYLVEVSILLTNYYICSLMTLFNFSYIIYFLDTLGWFLFFILKLLFPTLYIKIILILIKLNINDDSLSLLCNFRILFFF